MRIAVFIAFVSLFFSCKKSELVTVTDNQPPPDNSIATAKIINYINKSYILLLGREPSSTELSNATASLSASSLDSLSRISFINTVVNAADYRPNIYNKNKELLLNNVDTAEFTNWISIFSFLLSDSTYLIQWPALTYERDRMIVLRNAYNEFVTGSISLAEVQRRMCNNYLYDQINMGAANFVIFSFQQLINRNATQAEQSAGISMVNGNNAILFLTAGNSKTDYLNILTGGNNYYEGQVAKMYLQYLNRSPNTNEMVEGTILFANSGLPTDVIKQIFTTDEFIGL